MTSVASVLCGLVTVVCGVCWATAGTTAVVLTGAAGACRTSEVYTFGAKVKRKLRGPLAKVRKES